MDNPNQRGQVNSLGINPGQLRHQITLLEPSNAVGESGTETTFAPANPPVKVWAKIEGLRAEDAFQPGEDIGTITLKITARFHPAFQGNKRIQRWNGNQYVIRGTPENVLEQNAYMIFYADGIGANQ